MTTKTRPEQTRRAAAKLAAGDALWHNGEWVDVERAEAPAEVTGSRWAQVDFTRPSGEKCSASILASTRVTMVPGGALPAPTVTSTSWQNLDQYETADRINEIVQATTGTVKVNGREVSALYRSIRAAQAYGTGSVGVTVKALSSRSKTGEGTLYVKLGDTVTVEHDELP